MSIRSNNLNNSGAVSMLSVMIFAMIITVITTAYIASVTSQQQNALNFDQSVRAYYAAESGVQDTVRSLRIAPEKLVDNKVTCPPWDGGGTVGLDSRYNLSYTCQLVTTPNDITGELQPGGAKNAIIKLEPSTPVPGPYKVVIRWSAKTTGKDTYYPSGRTGASQKLLAKYHKWNRDNNPSEPLHAMLRATVIAHPTTNFSRSSIKQRVMFLNPTRAADKDADPTLSYSDDSLNNASYSQQDQFITNAACYPSNNVTDTSFGEYSCKAVINLGSGGNAMGYNLSSQALYLRLSSVYRSTNFSVELLNASGTGIDLKNGQAAIDITGKSGTSTFRRIKQTVSVGGYFEDSMPDAALVSAEGICKLYSLTNSYASFSSECNPNPVD